MSYNLEGHDHQSDTNKWVCKINSNKKNKKGKNVIQDIKQQSGANSIGNMMQTVTVKAAKNKT